MLNWQECRKAIREDRKETPVLSFVWILLVMVCVAVVVTFAALFIYRMPIAAFSVTVVIVVLWKLYQRI